MIMDLQERITITLALEEQDTRLNCYYSTIQIVMRPKNKW